VVAVAVAEIIKILDETSKQKHARTLAAASYTCTPAAGKQSY
jgi:hypothetical protein